MDKITFEPVFWQRTHNEVCMVCSYHDWMIVQRIGSLYTMHTCITKLSSTEPCIHVWRTRRDDPLCLAGFKPTERMAPAQSGNYDSFATAIRQARYLAT